MAQLPTFVLGMHRSGTSCLTGSLQQRGLHLGTVYESRPHNRKGNRENQRVMDLNDAVLQASGGRWDRPPETLRWDDAHASQRDAILATLQAGADGGQWGFKDPRTLLTLPFWMQGLPGGARFVGTFRHPASVVRSLRARDPGMPVAAGLSLWSAYNRRLLDLHLAAPFPLACFDVDPGAYRRTVDAIVAHLGWDPVPDVPDPFFEDELRNHAPPDTEVEGVTPAHLALHDALTRASLRWRA